MYALVAPRRQEVSSLPQQRDFVQEARMSISIERQITGGPSKLELMLAFFDTQKRRSEIHFVFDGTKDLTHCVIRTISYGNDNEQWIIQGNLDSMYGDNLSSQFSARYNTNTRTGVFSFTD